MDFAWKIKPQRLFIWLFEGSWMKSRISEKRNYGCQDAVFLAQSKLPCHCDNAPYIHHCKDMVWWRQTSLMSWTWTAQFSAKVIPQGQADAWDNGVEDDMCLRNFMQIEINKMYPPRWWALLLYSRSLCTFWKTLVFLAQTASSNLTSYHMHQPFTFPPVTCSLKETYLAITENITMNHPRFQKSRFQETPAESLELWQPLCCVCVWCPHKRTMAVS